MTRRVAILVEGQTEEAFVQRVLQPHIGFDHAFLTPIVVHTSRAADGRAFRGGGNWSHYRDQLLQLLSQPHWDMITTMIDYYAYPRDAPGCDCVVGHLQPSCVSSREASIAASFVYDARFRPFIELHEFETLVIAAGATLPHVFDDASAPVAFASMISSCGGNAERINDSPQTAPSKRVLATIPEYRKVRDGVAVLEGNLPAALPATPRFAQWVSEL